jgi:DHA1 family bicyclomycin/chloramphenicol resistance-like MFS transporter
MGAIQMGMGALASSALSLFNTRSAEPMILVMLFTSIVAFIILAIGRRKISPDMAV